MTFWKTAEVIKCRLNCLSKCVCVQMSNAPAETQSAIKIITLICTEFVLAEEKHCFVINQ